MRVPVHACVCVCLCVRAHACTCVWSVCSQEALWVGSRDSPPSFQPPLCKDWKEAHCPGLEIKDCFKGHEAVTWMTAHSYAQTRAEGQELVRKLQRLGWIAHLEDRFDFQDNEELYVIVRSKDGTIGAARDSAAAFAGPGAPFLFPLQGRQFAGRE